MKRTGNSNKKIQTPKANHKAPRLTKAEKESTKFLKKLQSVIESDKKGGQKINKDNITFEVKITGWKRDTILNKNVDVKQDDSDGDSTTEPLSSEDDNEIIESNDSEEIKKLTEEIEEITEEIHFFNLLIDRKIKILDNKESNTKKHDEFLEKKSK